MITKNFKMILAWLLQYKGQPNVGYTPVIDVDGNTRYMSNNDSLNFPMARSNSVVANGTNNTGIWIGSGNTSATEDDYRLVSRIISGLTVSSVTTTQGVDGSGNPYVTHVFTLTNTTGSDITVAEIGYVQQAALATTLGGNANNYGRLLLDRTVLSNPVTVPANGSAAIEYTLKTVLPAA